MIIELDKVSKECIEKMEMNQEMNISKEEQDKFDFATECHICKKAFGKKFVRRSGIMIIGLVVIGVPLMTSVI